MEGGAFHQDSMAKESRQSVFVFMHQTRPDCQPSYTVLTREYFAEDFFHPAYLFMRPDGTEVDKANRHHHEGLAAPQMLDILKKIRREWGPGLTEKEYVAACASLAEAEKLLAAGDADGARAAFAPLAALKQRCGVAARAKAALRLLAARDELLAEAPEGEVLGLVKKCDLVGALREVRRRGRGEAPSSFEEKLTARLREMIRLVPVRYEQLLLSTGAYHYVRAEWETDLPPFDGLTLQLSYRTDDARAYEGWGTFDGQGPSRHHRAAVSLTSGDIRCAKVANVRAQLWLGDLLLAESLGAKEPTDFPVEESHVRVGPDLLRADETLGAGPTEKPREWNVGRYPAKP